jgi:N-acetylglucosamine malate deacetylase 2
MPETNYPNTRSTSLARVLSVAAHPDDELFGAGYLAKLASEGNELYMLCTTRGEGGEVGDPPVGPKDRLGEYREAEMRFLDFVDPWMEIDGEARAIDASPEEFAAAIAAHLAELRPDVVVTHGSNGEYGHPQHVYTHQSVRAAIRSLAPWRPAELLTWCANTGANADDKLTNRDDPADFALDISPWFEAKLAAMAAHRSQHAMFMRNNKAADWRQSLRRQEAFRRWPTDGRS